VTGATGTQTLTAPDGRTLTFATWGDPDGFPVFSLHGAPGSRFARHFDEGLYMDLALRVITYDRPGYGGSDRHQGRRMVDCVSDVAAIADALGLERFGVIGGSVGGPHSLAVAARMPERVTRAACVVGLAPFDTPDFDWFEGMDPLNVNEIRWALEGEDALARGLGQEAAELLEQVASDPSRLFSDWQLSEADRAEVARKERYEVTRQTINEAFRSGVWGYVDDTFCLTQPWGFDVVEIRVPTQVTFGLTDVLAPRQHGEWLARNVPNTEVIIHEHGGHMADPDQIAERYRWLAQPT
jgi:pimeloyl-ACP methyl ester carboxylesterase